jgi:hypothetical protein
MVFIFGIMVKEKRLEIYFEYYFFSIAAGDLIAREAGAYSCDPSGKT